MRRDLLTINARVEVMYAIGEFVEECEGLTAEAFCANAPYPFLLHAASSPALDPVIDITGGTLDRMVIVPPLVTDECDEFQRSKTPTRELPAISPQTLYMVFPVVPRRGQSIVSLGCGPRCDVRINDRSVSKVHAHMELQEGRYFLRDNDSSSGTQVKDRLLAPDDLTEVRAGETITLGFVELTLAGPREFFSLVSRLFLE